MKDFDIITFKYNDKENYNQALKIRRTVFIEGQGVPENIEIDQNENLATYFLGHYQQKPVVTGRIREYGQNIKFERIATLPDFRGLGLGKKLMSFMLSYSLEKFPNHQPMMNAQESAISFYTQLGWQPEGDYFYEADIKHQKLTYPLNQ